MNDKKIHTEWDKSNQRMKNTKQVPEILSDVLCNDLPKGVNEKDECKTPQSFYLKLDSKHKVGKNS